MSEQAVVQVADEPVEGAEPAARERQASAEPPVADSLRAEIGRVGTDEDFTERARRLLRRDREILERLAR